MKVGEMEEGREKGSEGNKTREDEGKQLGWRDKSKTGNWRKKRIKSKEEKEMGREEY